MDDLNFASDATLPSARAMAKSQAPPPHCAMVEPLLPFCCHRLSHMGSPIHTAGNAYLELPFCHHRLSGKDGSRDTKREMYGDKGRELRGKGERW